MSAFDIVAIVIFVVGFVAGLVYGLVRILGGIATLVVAFVLACRFHAAAASWLAWTGGSERVLRLVGYLLILFGVMFVGGIAGWILRKLMRVAMLGWLDRLGGAVMGLVAAVLTLALLVLPLLAYAPGAGTSLERSRITPYLAVVADVAVALAPQDLARRYEEGVRELRMRWSGAKREVVVRMRGERASDGVSDPRRGS